MKTTKNLLWTTEEAIALATQMELTLRVLHINAHVALTGGCLYHEPRVGRKDADFVIYSHRGYVLDRQAVEDALTTIGIIILENRGRTTKAMYGLGDIDLFFPELTYEMDIEERIDAEAAGRLKEYQDGYPGGR